MTVASPAWFQAAQREIGVHEKGTNAGPEVERYIGLAHCGQVGNPWCAIFANAMVECCGLGLRGTRSAMARSFEGSPRFDKLPGPALGAIVTFWRGSRAAGTGHVGFYNGEVGDYISVLGGNEGDMVRVERYVRARKGWGLVGYYWPKAIEIPVLGAIRPLLADGATHTGKVI